MALTKYTPLELLGHFRKAINNLGYRGKKSFLNSSPEEACISMR